MASGKAARSSTRSPAAPAVRRLLAADSRPHQGAMGAEGAEAADFHLAGLAGTPPAVLADAGGFGVEVFVAAGHDGEIGAGLHSVNVPRKVSAAFPVTEAAYSPFMARLP